MSKIQAHSWMSNHQYQNFIWINASKASEIMQSADAILNEYIQKKKQFLLKAIRSKRTMITYKPATSTSDVYLQLVDLFYNKFNGAVYPSSGNDKYRNKVPFIMVPYFNFENETKTFMIKLGVINTKGEYIRTKDIEFKPSEKSPGAAATQFIKKELT